MTPQMVLTFGSEALSLVADDFTAHTADGTGGGLVVSIFSHHAVNETPCRFYPTLVAAVLVFAVASRRC